MHYGISTFVTDQGINPAELGRAVEERGFESLFVAEHTHIPASRVTPYPGGGELPHVYYRALDPFVSLAMAAAATERLRLGTGICLVPQRNTFILAKEVASLDHASGGRFIFGIGTGWNREEMRNHGTDPATRTALMRERVLAMKRIWNADEAEFHGDHVDFDPVFAWPKPHTRPHPPILVGGSGSTVFDRVLEYGDGWMPIFPAQPEVAAADMTELARRARDAGRGEVPVSLFSVPAKPEHIVTYTELGVQRLLFHLGTHERDKTLRRLDDIAATITDAEDTAGVAGGAGQPAGGKAS